MIPFKYFEPYFSEAIQIHRKMIKSCGGVSPRTYGEAINQSKKRKKKKGCK